MSATELLDGIVNTVEIKHEDGKPRVYLNGTRMDRLRGYDVRPDIHLRKRGRWISYVTLELISNDVVVDGEQVGREGAREHVDDGKVKAG